MISHSSVGKIDSLIFQQRESAYIKCSSVQKIQEEFIATYIVRRIRGVTIYAQNLIIKHYLCMNLLLCFYVNFTKDAI
jgi:lipopolysaccharide biosynthesis protein